MTRPDLSTSYLGLPLRSPLVASSCPLTGEVQALRKLEEAGIGAIVLPSLFQEQIEHEELEIGRLHAYGAESYHEASGYFPELVSYNTGPDGYLHLVESARIALEVPVIASLNGLSARGWASHARRLESAGAHALELNLFHVPTDPRKTSAEVEELYLQQVRAVRAAVKIPIAVKLGPHLSAPAHLAAQMEDAGADGLVLFNRFLEPDIDLETLEVVPRLELSRPAEMRMPLRWIAILSATRNLSLASTSGVHGAPDALKLLLAGASAVMVASAILMHGPSFVRRTLTEMEAWLVEHDYSSVRQLRGSMNHANCPDPRGYERLNYMKALTSFSSPVP
jgi:dihydroorotate dehydrogenase (fumarate)